MTTIIMLSTATIISVQMVGAKKNNQNNPGTWTDSFISEHCKSWAATGGNQYWTLTPGRVTIFKGIVDGEPQTATITVTNKTQTIGGISTRTVNDTVTNSDTGEVREIAIDHFAVCKDSNSVFYFGENTTAYERETTRPYRLMGTWRKWCSCWCCYARY